MSTLIVGCGYLGRRVGQRLSNRHDKVYGTVRSEARASSLGRWGITPLIADVLDVESLKALPAVDRVVYCVGFDRSSGIAMRRVYVEGLANVFQALAGRTARMLYVSSTSVYGQTDGSWVDEDSPTEPTTESGRICLEAEQSAGSLARESGMELVVVRLSGLYGPGRIIGRTTVLNGDPIGGDPEKYLNLIHVEDAASASISALDWGVAGRLYLASDDRPMVRREYFRWLAILLSEEVPPIRFEPSQPASSEAARDASNKRVCNQRIKSELGLALKYLDFPSGSFETLDMERSGWAE
jgi:nucleoside-diphosphate-sugar epimerase